MQVYGVTYIHSGVTLTLSCTQPVDPGNSTTRIVMRLRHAWAGVRPGETGSSSWERQSAEQSPPGAGGHARAPRSTRQPQPMDQIASPLAHPLCHPPSPHAEAHARLTSLTSISILYILLARLSASPLLRPAPHRNRSARPSRRSLSAEFSPRR
jgi:hypothetical protein